MARGVGLNQLRTKCEKIEREVRSLKGMITVIERSKNPDDPVVDSIQELIGFYCEQWKARYKCGARLTGRNVGALKSLMKDFGIEKAKMMIVAYFHMNDSFFIKKRHDPATLLSNVMSVGHFAESGKIITSHDAKEMERTAKAKNLFDMVESGKL